jgi:serine/threonine protein phosphatase PrpC
MFAQKLNSKVLPYFTPKTTKEVGFMCILNFPKANLVRGCSHEVQRFSRIEESNYRKTLNNSAILIQKHIRRFLALILLKRLKQEHEAKIRKDKATVIQSFFRKTIAVKKYTYLKLQHKLLLARDSAALAIQTNYRISLLKQHIHRLYIESRLLKLRTLAALNIQKTIRGYFVRKDLYFMRSKKLPLLITWKYPAVSVHMAGDFTQPSWKSHLPLLYSRHLKLFFSTFFMENNISPKSYQIKFIVDSAWLCDGNLPIVQDSEGNYNNIFTVTRPRPVIPKAYSSGLLSVPMHSTPPSARTTDCSLPSAFKHSNLSDLLSHDRPTGQLSLSMSSYKIARPKKHQKELSDHSSADACFVSQNMQFFAIADGVSEWRTFGLDPSFFPNELVQHLADELLAATIATEISDLHICETLEETLRKAYTETQAFGSSTILAGLCKNGVLHSLSLGDSGFLVLRKREHSRSLAEVYRSAEQQHSFNCPYQLVHLPSPDDYDRLIDKGLGSFVALLKRSKQPSHDQPKDASLQMIPLQPFDVIVAGSDGLFDNLYDDDVRAVAERYLEAGLTPEDFCEKVAKELALQAVHKAWDSDYKSPFSKRASKYGKKFVGGKLDDVSVVVAMAVGENSPRSL